MINKKKLIKYIYFFILVLALQMIFSSTCLATDYDDFNLPVEFWEAYIDYFDTYLIPRKADFPLDSCPVTASQLRDYWNTNLSDYTKNYFEQYGADLRHLCLITSFGGGTYFKIYPYFMNNTIGNVDNYCTFYFTNNYYNCSRNSNITGRVFSLTVYTNGTFGNSKNDSFPSSVYTHTSADDFDVSISSCYGPFFGVNSAPLNTVQVNNVPNTNNTQWHLKGYYNLFAEPEPENPSGDVSGDTSGDIPISPSGDNGSGTIDYTNQLNNINTSINNLQNQISGDTQNIINQMSGETQKITNTLTDYDSSEGEDDVSSLIDNIQSSLSGDLSSSEIFSALEDSEKGFLDLISGQAGDFEIHWNDVFYNGIKLISAGQVNFSAMCRENETLGNIKEKLNIILSALCGLALIKYLYNLLLATLGIDNPYLYDSNTDSDYIKTVDKNTGITTFSGVDKDGTRWHYTYNPKNSKKGGKKK